MADNEGKESKVKIREEIKETLDNVSHNAEKEIGGYKNRGIEKPIGLNSDEASDSNAANTPVKKEVKEKVKQNSTKGEGKGKAIALPEENSPALSIKAKGNEEAKESSESTVPVNSEETAIESKEESKEKVALNQISDALGATSTPAKKTEEVEDNIEKSQRGKKDTEEKNEEKTEEKTKEKPKVDEKEESILSAINFGEEEKKETTGGDNANKDGEKGNGEKLEAKVEDLPPTKREEGLRAGTLVGRSSGYGAIITEEVKEIKGEDGKEKKEVSYKVTPFAKKEEDIAGAERKWLSEQMEAAKAEGEEYYGGFMQGNNAGYLEGQKLKAEKAAGAAAKAYKEKQANPSYKFGKELGTLVGALSAQGKEDLEYKGVNGKAYKATVSATLANGMKGKDPNGELVVGENPEKESKKEEGDGDKKEKASASSLFREAFLQGNNSAYQVALTAQNKVPSHAELLSDPDFKIGYDWGNQYAKGKGDMAANTKKRDEYYAASSEAKAAKDEKFKKEKGGFIYGNNCAFYQMKAEKEAKEKAERAKKLSDPIFMLGHTAGNMKGILVAIYDDEDIQSIAQKGAAKLEEKGVPFKIPTHIQKVFEQDGLPKGDYKEGAAVGIKLEKEDKDKQTEQVSYFRESYARSFNQGYKTGLDERGNLAANKFRSNPEFVEFFKTKVPVFITEADEEIKLNLGQAAAYVDYKIKKGDSSPEKLAGYQNTLGLIQNLVAKHAESKHYQSAYRLAYNDFSEQLVTGKGSFGKLFKHKEDLQAYQGKTPEEKAAYALGIKVANKQIEEEKKIEEKEGGAAEKWEKKKLLAKNIEAAIAAVKAKLKQDYSDLTEQEQAKIIQFFTNGYNITIYGDRVAKDKTNLGNNKAELNQALQAQLKDAKNIKGFEKQAAELFAQGAAEGYRHAFLFYKKNAAEGRESPTNYTETEEIEKRLKDNKANLEKIKDKTPTEENITALLNFYKGGYKHSKYPVKTLTGNTKSGDKSFGVSKGEVDGKSYAKGYAYAVKEANKESGISAYKKETSDLEEAYDWGYADGKKKAGYNAFKNKMIEGDDSLDLEPAMKESTSLVAQEVKKDVQIWHDIKNASKGLELVNKNKFIIYGDKGEKEIEINIQTAKKIVANSEEYITGAIEYRRRSKIEPFRRKEADKPDYYIKAKNDRNRSPKDEKYIQQVEEEADKKLVIYVEEYSERYRAAVAESGGDGGELGDYYKLMGFKAGFLRITNGKYDLPAKVKIEEKEGIEVDKQSASYLAGNELGATLGMRLTTGLLDEKNLDEELEDKAYSGMINKEYQASQKAGIKQGEYAAAQEPGGKVVPGKYKDLVSNPEEITEEIEKAYIEAYWHVKDVKCGEIAGLRAAATETTEDDYQMDSLYEVLASDDKVAADKKYGIKDANLFKTAFINAREAGFASGDAEKKLEDIETKGEEAKGEETNQEKVLKKAKENGIADAQVEEQEVDVKPYEEVFDLRTSEEPEEIELLYYATYWETRDSKAGEIQGLEAATAKEEEPMEAYYILIADYEEGTNEGIAPKIIKNKAVFQKTFEKGYKYKGTAEAKDLLAEAKQNKELDTFKAEEEKSKNLPQEIEKKLTEDIKKVAILEAYYRAAKGLDLETKMFAIKQRKDELSSRMFPEEEELCAEQGKGKIIESTLKLITNLQVEEGKIEARIYKQLGGKESTSSDDSEQGVVKKKKLKDSESSKTTGGSKKDSGGNVVNQKGQTTETVTPAANQKTPKPPKDQKDKDAIYEQYNNLEKIEKDKINASYLASLAEMTASFQSQAMADLTTVSLSVIGGTSSGETQTIDIGAGGTKDDSAKGETTEEDDLQAIADSLTNQGSSVRDINLGNLKLIRLYQEQEQKIEYGQGEIELIREGIWDLDDALIEAEDDLVFSEDDLEQIDQEIRGLEAKKPLNASDRKKLRGLRKNKKEIVRENKSNEREVNRLLREMDNSYDDIEAVGLNVERFLKTKIKLKPSGDDAGDDILDYLDYFEETLYLAGSYTYMEPVLKMKGDGDFTVEKNAEDVMNSVQVKLDKNAFHFKAKGLKYVEDANSITLFSGSAIIPKLEGDSHQGTKGNYNFDALTFDLSKGIHMQLELQRDKLVGGGNSASKGTRKMPNTKNIDGSQPQNTSSVINYD